MQFDPTHCHTPLVKAIKKSTFRNCRELTTVIFNDGLERIEEKAFYKCISLQCIVILRTVKVIHKRHTFGGQMWSFALKLRGW